MGRKAKLRSTRHTESKRLAQRHQRQRDSYASSITRGATVDVRPCIDALGGIESFPSLEEADARIRDLSPRQFTKLMGFSYATLIATCSDQLDPKSRRILSDICAISSELFCAFTEYQGFCMFRLSPLHDWARLRQHVISLTDIPQFADGLRAFGSGPGPAGRGMALYSMMTGSMLGAAFNLTSALSEGGLSQAEAWPITQFWLLVGDHVDNAADIAAGRVLCDAGELVLHYRHAERLKDAELCLSHRAADGLLHFHPDPAVSLVPVGAIRKLRKFVHQYKGSTMAGKISEHPAAARLCRAIGLTVRNDHGFLIPRQPQAS